MFKLAAAFCLAFLLIFALPGARATEPNLQTPIGHIVIIMEENHSFDNYFGTFPGANGIANAPSWAQQKAYHTRVTLDPCECYPTGYYNGTNWTWPNSDDFGYYNGSDIPEYWSWAKQFVLFDNYYSSFMGPTLPNHLFLIAGQNGGDTDDLQEGGNGNLKLPTIFNEINQAHLSWAYYADTAMVANNWDPLPLMGNRSYLAHLHPHWQILRDIASGNLANVSWVMPMGDAESEQAPYPPKDGVEDTTTLVRSLQASKYWNSTAILLTFDESGGFYDHVVPPKVDGQQLGFRVPLIMLSPWAKRGMIDHTLADHTSTLAFIESVFGLPCLSRDCHMSNLFDALDFRPSVSYSSGAGVLTVVTGRFQNATVWVGGKNSLSQFTALVHSPIVNGSATFALTLQPGTCNVVVIILSSGIPVDPEYSYNVTL